MSDDKHKEQDQKHAQGIIPDDMANLDPEEALRAFMQVDPEKVRERLEQDRGQEND